MPSSREIWHLSDGKPGHVNQVRGLIEALRKHIELRVHLIHVPSRFRSLLHWLRGSFPPGIGLPDPDLILAAGQATHLAVLAARRARGGKSILMMAPQLPARWFDLCIVPEHDGVAPADNIIFTRGVVNHITPCTTQSPRRGLILIGGPSKNYHWSADLLTEQVRAVACRDANIHWTVTTSRRTPHEYAQTLRGLALKNLQVIPAEETPMGWVGAQLSECGQVWVTEDSVSMVYEALTSGAAVGLFAMPRARTGRMLRAGTARVMAGLDKLAEERMITTFQAWKETGVLTKPPAKIDEASRCARLLVERFAL